MRGGFVYIVSNRPNGTLYTVVTADVVRRAYQHRTGTGASFTRRYGLKRLIWFEFHDEIVQAIQRETNIKYWPRAWKVRLIEKMNPEWKDLYPTLIQEAGRLRGTERRRRSPVMAGEGPPSTPLAGHARPGSGANSAAIQP